jgi:hypothetical protein
MTASNRLQALYDASKKTWPAGYRPEDADGGELAPDGRVMEIAHNAGVGMGRRAHGRCSGRVPSFQRLAKVKNEERSPRIQSRFETKRRRLCGVPGVTERLVVSSPSVCGVWAHRML